jgi:hypothetical protein
MQSPKNKMQCFGSRPRATKGKTSPNLHADFPLFLANSDSECSAYSSGLFTYVIYPCTPSPLASRCQVAPPAPSPLAHELTHAAATAAVSPPLHTKTNATKGIKNPPSVEGGKKPTDAIQYIKSRRTQ